LTPSPKEPDVSLDIVVPAYNEEHRIDRMLQAYRASFTDGDVRFLTALDRCSDGTADVVRRHAAEDSRVELHEYPKLGKGGVIMETFRRCAADFLAFVDADCATPPSELQRLVEAACHADGAIACRWHPTAVVPVRRPMARRVASAGFAVAVRCLFHLPYRDTQCGAKVLRRDVAAAIAPLLSSRDFLFDVDLLLVARSLGYDVIEVPTIWIDQDGSHLDAYHEAKRMAASLLRLWVHHHVLPVEPAAAPSPQLPVIDLSQVDRVAS
jgi:glycosyltransferase involved in cell wall biosynthesis